MLRRYKKLKKEERRGELQDQLKTARKEAAYYKKLSKETGDLRLRETEELSMVISRLKETEKKLREALSQIKALSGLLPICSSCKKIRNDKGYWEQIETYIRSHSEVEFSHGICPECAKKLYPEFYEK